MMVEAAPTVVSPMGPPTLLLTESTSSPASVNRHIVAVERSLEFSDDAEAMLSGVL